MYGCIGVYEKERRGDGILERRDRSRRRGNAWEGCTALWQRLHSDKFLGFSHPAYDQRSSFVVSPVVRALFSYGGRYQKRYPCENHDLTKKG